MKCIEGPLPGCFILEPTVLHDDRGYFMESFNVRTFRDITGLQVDFVQDNQSFSHRGSLRGLHYQTGTHAQAKLVRVLQGEVLDAVVDIRPGSATYGRHFTIVLSEQNRRQLFVPRGFAHGFQVLSETAVFFYKCDNFYDAASEAGIFYGDPSLGIAWETGIEVLISEKDRRLPSLHNANPIW